jgi:hypothetical protein
MALSAWHEASPILQACRSGLASHQTPRSCALVAARRFKWTKSADQNPFLQCRFYHKARQSLCGELWMHVTSLLLWPLEAGAGPWFDAAILFSDILVAPDALPLCVMFAEGERRRPDALEQPSAKRRCIQLKASTHKYVGADDVPESALPRKRPSATVAQHVVMGQSRHFALRDLFSRQSEIFIAARSDTLVENTVTSARDSVEPST